MSALQAPSIRIHGTTATFVAEPGADVLYTIDGREPTIQSLLAPLDAPVELGQRNLVLKAVAYRDGERSPVTTTLYAYTPRPLVILPEDGVYDGHVTVQFQSEHEAIYFTTDGTVPSRSSVMYEGPFVLSQEGKVVVTAAMFVGERLVGSVARRTYEIAQAKLDPPEILPSTGTYTLPLRIALNSEESIRYTLDGSEPTLSSALYTVPIIVLQEGDVTVSCRAYPKSLSTNRRPSDVATMSYTLQFAANDGDVDAVDDVEHPVTVLPLANVEFGNMEEQLAVQTAERAAGMTQASEQVRGDMLKERDELVSGLRSAKREHRMLLEQLDAIQKELGVAAARKTVLQTQVAKESDLVLRGQERMEQLAAEQLALKQHLFSVNVEVNEAERLLRQASTERQALLRQQEALRRSLEETFLHNKKELSLVSPHLQDEVAEAAAAVAEQRHELWMLKETLMSLQRTLQKKVPNDLLDRFLPDAHIVDLPVVEAKVGIPRGKMRLITGPSGTGLHRLREEHKVQASIVQDGSELCIRVHGHARGVHNLIESVGRLLNE